MNKIRYDPGYHPLQYHALDLIFVRQLTSNCDLGAEIDEDVKRHEVDRFEAQYLLVSTLLPETGSSTSNDKGQECDNW